MNTKIRSLAFTSLSHFSVDGNALLFPVLIIYYEEIGLSAFIIGLMPVLYNLISGALSVYVGSYADRVDKDTLILTLGIFLNGVAALVFSLPFIFRGEAYEFLILGSVLLGIGQSIYHPIGATILSHTYGPKESPSYLGINGSFGSLGRSAFPFIVVFIIALLGNVLGLDLIVVYFLFAALLIFLGLKFFKRKDYQIKSPVIQKRPESKVSIKGAIPAFLVMLVVIVFLRSMFIMSINTYMPSYLVGLFHSKKIMASVLSFALIAPVVGQPIFGYLTSKFGGKFTITVTSIGLVIFFVLFLFLSKSLVTILVTYTFFAFFAFTGFPVLMGYVSQVVPREKSTSANAMVWGVGNTLGASTGIFLFDGLHLFTSMYNAFIVLLFFAIVSAVLVIYIPGKAQISAIKERDST